MKKRTRLDEHQRAYRCECVTGWGKTVFSHSPNMQKENEHYSSQVSPSKRMHSSFILMLPPAASFDALVNEELSFHSVVMLKYQKKLVLIRIDTFTYRYFQIKYRYFCDYRKLLQTKSCTKFNSLQKTQRRHISVSTRRGNRGHRTFSFFEMMH